MNCTFPQRDYCYDFQPGSSHPRWIKVGGQVGVYCPTSGLYHPVAGAPVLPCTYF